MRDTPKKQGGRMKALSTQQIESLYDSGINIFVRWSRGPKYDNRPSRDYQSGTTHAGLSAVAIGNWGGDYLSRRLSEYRFLRLKDKKIRPYIYTGEVIGVDTDGYELINHLTCACLGVWDEKEHKIKEEGK